MVMKKPILQNTKLQVASVASIFFDVFSIFSIGNAKQRPHGMRARRVYCLLKRQLDHFKEVSARIVSRWAMKKPLAFRQEAFVVTVLAGVNVEAPGAYLTITNVPANKDLTALCDTIALIVQAHVHG